MGEGEGGEGGGGNRGSYEEQESRFQQPDSSSLDVGAPLATSRTHLP